jgi:arylsulfatase A-like enzyme
MNTFDVLVGMAVVAAAALCVDPASAQAGPPNDFKKPNILFVLMDNLGYGELGVYGGGVLRGAPTPRIDEPAAEGTRLTNFNVEAQCTPSRSAIMAGRFPIRSGTQSFRSAASSMA